MGGNIQPREVVPFCKHLVFAAVKELDTFWQGLVHELLLKGNSARYNYPTSY